MNGTDRNQGIKKLPDAVFILAPMPSFLARELVTVAGYRLVAIPFAEAYCLDRISPTDVKGVHLDHAAFFVNEVPAYTYGINPGVPPTPCRTVATWLLLVGYSGTDPVAVSGLVDTVFDGGISTLIDPPALANQVRYFPLHAGTERYLHRNDPFLTPEMAQNLGRVLGGLGAFVSGLVAFYGFLRIRQLRRFEHFYHEIRQIELIAHGQEVDPEAPSDPAERLAYLEDRLLDIKSRALQDFAEGGLKGEGLMSGIVSLINDTRSSLARLDSTEPRALRGERRN
jgi:hypothetical protein